MLFMVIERFRDHDAKAAYRRFHRRGRMLPKGVTFHGSWVSADLGRCFQLMACDDVSLLQLWVSAWSDLVAFEIVPVAPGEAVAQTLAADEPESA